MPLTWSARVATSPVVAAGGSHVGICRRHELHDRGGLRVDRLSAADAWTLIEPNFVTQATVVALTGREYAALVRDVVAGGIAGGRAYDAVIAGCARKAGAEELLTPNRRHFEPTPAGVTIIEPTR